MSPRFCCLVIGDRLKCTGYACLWFSSSAFIQPFAVCQCRLQVREAFLTRLSTPVDHTCGLLTLLLLAEYGDTLRQELRSRDGVTDDSKAEMLERFEAFRKKSKMQIPDIERTIIKLSEQPQEAGLWARLLQRIAGWGLGVSQERLCPSTQPFLRGMTPPPVTGNHACMHNLNSH